MHVEINEGSTAAARQGRHRRDRRPDRELAQHPDRGDRLAVPDADRALRAARRRAGAREVARRHRDRPRNRFMGDGAFTSETDGAYEAPRGLFGGGDGHRCGSTGSTRTARSRSSPSRRTSPCRRRDARLGAGLRRRLRRSVRARPRARAARRPRGAGERAAGARDYGVVIDPAATRGRGGDRHRAHEEASYVRFPDAVTIVEVLPRDGLQSLDRLVSDRRQAAHRRRSSSTPG